MAIVPFDVPETFAPPGNESLHFGRTLAEKYQLALHPLALVPIIELFNRDRWPGKRAEYFTGNYGAIELARAAGYDFVMLGYLEELTDDHTLKIFTKIIDTQNAVTVWFAQTEVSSSARAWGRALGNAGIGQEQPERFAFSERVDEAAKCTADGIENEEPNPA